MPFDLDFLPAPGVPAFSEDLEEFLHDGTFKEDPRVTPSPPSSSKVKTTVFICDIKPACKRHPGIDQDQLPVIAVDIVERGRPFEGMGSPYLDPCPSHVLPKASGSPYGAEMVMEEVDSYSLAALLLEDLG